MTEILPPFPRFVFTIAEPISLFAGAVAPVVAPSFFITQQIPYLQHKAHNVSPHETILALQLGNLYFLLMLLGIGILRTTTEPKVVHVYIWMLWAADIGHVAATGAVLGTKGLMDFRSHNATTWGNVGFTIALFTMRSLYLAGVFGEDHVPGAAKAKKTRRPRTKAS